MTTCTEPIAGSTCSLPAGHPGKHDPLPAGPDDGCPACADNPETYQLAPLPAELTDGLTTWGTFGGAQIRVESPFLRDPDGNPIETDHGPAVGPPIGCLYIAFRTGAYQSDEDGNPYRLDLVDARALRDLLNIATARGVL